MIEGSGNGKAQGEKTIRRGSRHLSEKCSRGRRGEQKQVFLPNKANRSFRINKKFWEEGKKATKKRNETTDRGVMQWLLAVATRLGNRRSRAENEPILLGEESTGLPAYTLRGQARTPVATCDQNDMAGRHMRLYGKCSRQSFFRVMHDCFRLKSK